jgi:hypothetical protein
MKKGEDQRAARGPRSASGPTSRKTRALHFATSRSVSVFAFSTDVALNYVAATLFLRGRRTDRTRSSDPEMGNIFLWKVALTGTIRAPGRALDYLQQLL